MKTPSRPTRRPAPSEDEIRARARLLYEQSGRVPNRDIENWLEAKARLEAADPPQPAPPRRHGSRRPRANDGPQGFTMPPSDASLWIDQSSCD